MERLALTSEDRVLAVVAHPDDMEYGASCAVAKWAEQGIDVAYLLLTHGEHGIAGMDPATTREVRTEEQRAACDIVGAGELDLLDFPDGTLTYGLALREAITKRIREFRPTVVLTQDWAGLAPWGLNQADHRVAGLAAADAARDAGNEFVFPDAGEKHQVAQLLVTGHNDPDCGVEVAKRHVDAGAASLDAHEAYFKALPDHPTGEELVGGAAEEGGKALGCDLAILFKRYQL